VTLLAGQVFADTTLSFWNGDIAKNILNMAEGTHNPYREVNEWLNSMFYSFTGLEFVSDFVIRKLGSEMGYYMVSYLRDLFAGTLVYWITAGVWHIVIYRVYGKTLFVDKGRPFPTSETIVDQMTLAQASLFVYAALPILSEFLIESKLTKTYYYIDQIGGWGFYCLYFVIYLSIVEVGIYWVHRTLHTNKFLYKYIHALHHKYNKQVTMTPWCSIAFNPIDGILQVRVKVFPHCDWKLFLFLHRHRRMFSRCLLFQCIISHIFS
jgi:sterol desaturase/sphingolipid hydroxylase (fatty acid hydroxylase superfamily)